MITLPNGFSFDFCCASGALGFDGRGYWWEQPLRWLRLLRPREFTIIAKTITLYPRRGNLRWWCPWRCVRLIPNGAVNAVGLTNPGMDRWIDGAYERAVFSGYNLIASIYPEGHLQAATMANTLSVQCPSLKAIEINLSCPNINHHYYPVEIARAVRENTGLPLIAKLGHDMVEAISMLQEYVDCFDLINTALWDKVFPGKPSPLARYGLVGGVSGGSIREYAVYALMKAVDLTDKPIISGGSISSLDEVLFREQLGAKAFSIGTLFLRRPWKPNQIVRAYRQLRQAKLPG